MTKEELQKQTIESLSDKKVTILNWATGVGKSKAAILLAEKWKAKKILLVVAELVHKENWKQEFIRQN